VDTGLGDFRTRFAVLNPLIVDTQARCETLPRSLPLKKYLMQVRQPDGTFQTDNRDFLLNPGAPSGCAIEGNKFMHLTERPDPVYDR